MDTKVVIWSRTVTLGRGGKAIWGQWVSWRKYSKPENNIKDALRFAQGYLKRRKIGVIVYVGRPRAMPTRAVPIWHAKYGTDGSIFMSWKTNPVADYWRRRVS